MRTPRKTKRGGMIMLGLCILLCFHFIVIQIFFHREEHSLRGGSLGIVEAGVSNGGKWQLDKERPVVTSRQFLRAVMPSSPKDDDGGTPALLETRLYVAPVGSNGSAPLIGPIVMPSVDQHNSRQQAVVKAMQWAWKGYKEFAFGYDVLDFREMKGKDWNGYDIGLTLVDSLDTMYMMQMTTEFEECVTWIRDNYKKKFRNDVSVNLFETTIRELAGLLSAYHLSGQKVLFEAATYLGERLIFAFTSTSSIPYSDVNLQTGIAANPIWGQSSLAEVSTIQLEFKYLSKLTGTTDYAEKADAVMDHLASLPKTDGMLPIYVNALSGRSSGDTITLGARGDSYYEYLLKQWLLSGRSNRKYRDRYEEAITGILKRLLHKSKPNGLSFISELHGSALSHKMDHLVCFLPGVLALGYVNGFPLTHLEEAERLAYTCYQMYKRQGSGLAPEIVVFSTHDDGVNDFFVKPNDDFNLLRPETVESLMILYTITKKEQYRTWGWNIFQAFEKHSKLATGGYATLRAVSGSKPQPFREEMESFFLAETLKYLFLLFADDPQKFIPLDKYIFNTEAHPIPIWEH